MRETIFGEICFKCRKRAPKNHRRVASLRKSLWSDGSKASFGTWRSSETGNVLSKRKIALIRTLCHVALGSCRIIFIPTIRRFGADFPPLWHQQNFQIFYPFPSCHVQDSHTLGFSSIFWGHHPHPLQTSYKHAPPPARLDWICSSLFPHEGKDDDVNRE